MRVRRRILLVLAASAVVAGAAVWANGPDTAPVEMVAGAVPTIPVTSTTTTTTTTIVPTTTTVTVPATVAPKAPRATTAPRPPTTKKAVVSPAPTPSGTGVVAAFYYGWYPENWGVGSRFHPVAGNYDSKDITTVRRQIDQMRYGGIQAGIASWWGPGHRTDQAFGVDLAAAEGTPFKWALYYEPEGPGFANQSPDQLRASLQSLLDRYMNHPNYLRVDGKPVVFVWPDGNDRCDMVARWNQTNTLGLHVVQKRFPGSSGCLGQAQSWHDYSPDHFSIQVAPWSYSIGPGFWKFDESAPRLSRNPASFETAARSMATSPAMWKLVTTFNEWGEGTAIEPATEWASPSGYGVYLDILHGVLGSR